LENATFKLIPKATLFLQENTGKLLLTVQLANLK
jgi:hypothetical protein